MDARERYFELLRQSLKITDPEKEDVVYSPQDLKQILHLCQIHGTGPLVYNELLRSSSPLVAEKQLQMKQICMQNMLLQSEWERMIVRTWKALGDVRAVLMKGFSYARLYPLPYLRSWGDLDIWVGPEQYHRACGLLRDAFPDAKHHDEEWDELKHYCFVFPNGMAIELHRVSMDFLSAQDQAYWETLSPSLSLIGQGDADTIEVGGVRVPIFECNFDILFCFMHSWEHFCGTGIPLKQVADLTLLVKKLHTGSDPTCSFAKAEDYLRQHLTALRMLEIWRYYGYMACRVFGVSMDEWPLLSEINQDVRTHGERLYEQVITEGQCRPRDYGESSDRYEAREKARQMNVVARKWLTLRGRVNKARFLYRFAPRYALYVLGLEIKKGLRRTIRREAMINY